MCGIGGIAAAVPQDRDSIAAKCRAMADKLRHRGPDDRGEWIDPTARIGLIHTRLAIIDLSPLGHQPMSTPDGRFTIVYNGEVYNYQALRAELVAAGVELRSTSDTEVLLHLFAREGVSCLSRLSGMYAFAIWDKSEESLILARGPLGIKPLYYWDCGNQLAFASELRAVLASDLGPRRLNGNALNGYFLSGSVQEPDTLVEGIRMLPPGHYLVWKNGNVHLQCAWSLQFKNECMDRDEAVQSTSKLLEQSLKRHLVSDVPVGIFLSGGLDSTALLALSHRLGNSETHTFCISFDEAAFDEGAIAARTAKHFGAVHHEKRLRSGEAIAMLSDFTAAIDQPSIDGFNTYVVSRFASECGMKVVLSGLGGDELFGSYPSFQLIPTLMAWHQRFRRGGLIPWMRKSSRLIAGYRSYAKLARYLGTDGKALDAYHAVRSIFSPQDSARLANWFTGASQNFVEASAQEAPGEPVLLADQISQFEIAKYMLNQLLRDSDVMSMSQGLELRVPFLDRPLVEHLVRIPASIRLSSDKKLLLDAVPEIPSWVREQSKRGFTFPFASWLEHQWQREFAAIQSRSPVNLPKWYHRWSILALENFLSRNRIDCSNSTAVRGIHFGDSIASAG